MANLEHRAYGAMGSEFILHHCIVHPKRLVISLVVTTTLSVALRLHETDLTILWVAFLILAALLVLRLYNKVSEEALLVLPSLGVQVKTRYWLGHQETHFFDKSCVKGIVINEAVTMQSVLCYLAVLLTNGKTGEVKQVYPLFTRSWPRMKDLVYIYRVVHGVWGGQPNPSVLKRGTEEEQTSPPGAGDATLIQPGSRRPRAKDDQSAGVTKRLPRSCKS